MCGLFGFVDYRHKQPDNILNALCNALARESEVRGSHATGIAYVNNGAIEIYKQPKPASKIRFRLPKRITAVIGHTRHTTQGSERQNYNNHPFAGKVKNISFAFTHNGIVFNENQLRKDLKLPKTKIETDSYIAVQLLESQKELSLQSHKYMAEQLSGSFTFNTLDKHNNLYITKGSSPISIIHFKDIGLFAYASTENILYDAIVKTQPFVYFSKEPVLSKRSNIEIINLNDGEILKIDAKGTISKCEFYTTPYELEYDWYNFRSHYSGRFYDEFEQVENDTLMDFETEYLNNIIQVAAGFGISGNDIVMLNEAGFGFDEIEELIYDPDVFYEYVDVVKS